MKRPISATGTEHATPGGRVAAARGFSLIEILVVMVIVGVLMLAVTMALSGGGGERQLEREAQRWQMLFEHACMEAELGGRDIGVVLDPHGYAFRRRHGAVWQTPIDSGELRARQWLEGLQPQLLRDGLEVDLAAGTTMADGAPRPPALRCLASGERMPFTLILRLGDLRYWLQGSEQGPLQGAWLDEHS